MPLGFPPHIIALQINGDLAGLTFYQDRFGREVSYPKAPPKVPRTPGQLHQQNRWSIAMAAWNALKPNDRRLYEHLAKASGLPMTGTNVWVRLCLSPTDQLYHTLLRQSHLPLAPPYHC